MSIKKMVNEENILTDIIKRVKNRNFEGYTGIALKNIIFQTTGSIIAKIGALIFTIILARLLLPELFGLYNLALSTIMLFASFSNIGIGEVFVTFVSKELGKKREIKAKSYTIYLLKIKIIFFIITALILSLLAKFISETYYQKPIFLALLAGIFYIIFFELGNFLIFIFQSTNNFRIISEKEIIFQFSRIVLVSIAVLLSLKYSLSNEKILFYIILMLALSYLISTLYILYQIKKVIYLKSKTKKLNKNEIRKSNKFLLITSTLVFSGIFFSLIDKIMLGHFVKAEFIGYYSAAFGLIGALASLMGFGVVLLPVFSRIEKSRIDKVMKKSVLITLILGVACTIITIFIAPFAISLVYGDSYNISINMLRLLSLLLIPLPIIGIYFSYFMSIGKPQIIAKLLAFSIVINIVLNYLLILYFIRFGDLVAVYGVSIATIISQFIYLFGLMFYKKRI